MQGSTVTGPEPEKIVEVIVGLNPDNLSFMDVGPNPPELLDLDLSERCLLKFRLSDDLLEKGWRFQPTPISFENDWGQNFSSYTWTKYNPDPNAEGIPYAAFKVVFECKRQGIFVYSLFMLDALGQAIDLDPLIENGTGN
ncbi:hypothetical protein DMC25_03845 [Caulobacter sp. D4A]|uniref:hypothetical protein n=1 Tax=unclassified Caulobacter TaxID=2648921 RepID=UPI000D73F1BA|nr:MULTISPECIES: hypothetical protein [unclassified Caulobacter]PXA93180.1 hypothetical protein DMC25_03845 [Caulobacter sp. D4A]PXA95404.1 hypothetical protein DMC18_04040 [Caulobacter sp. D5]